MFTATQDGFTAGLKRMQLHKQLIIYFLFKSPCLFSRTRQTIIPFDTILISWLAYVLLCRIIRQTRDGAPCGPLIPKKRTWMQPTCQQAKKLPIVHLLTFARKHLSLLARKDQKIREQYRPTELDRSTDLQLQDSEVRFSQTPKVNIMHSRRTLLHTPFSGQPSGPSQPVAGTTVADGGAPGSNFDANVVMILAVLLCALICALGLNSIVRCALRCSSQVAVDPEPNPVTRLAKSGLRRKALRAMPILVYSAGLKLNTVSLMCAICLSDFEAGEHVRVLPKCNHGFHVRCIDRWLLARSTCPTCRQSLFGAPQKTSGCSEVSQAEPARVHTVLVPLRHEGLVTPYDF